MSTPDSILDAIAALPHDWHGAGCLDGKVIKAIRSYADPHRFEVSVETGVGKSTLILSHCSAKHYAFATNDGGSISRTRESDLLHRDTAVFVEGPCQKTLPTFAFDEPIDFALIDGGHGYPFPELDYYHIYPHLRPNAILAIDDIHIPTIHNMFQVLCADDMFTLDRIVCTTAFLRRTQAPTFDPYGDGWWTQAYNRRYFPIPIVDETGEVVPYTAPGNTMPC